MRRRLPILLMLLVIAGLVGLFLFNGQLKLLDVSRLEVKTDSPLSKSKIKIKLGLYSIDRKNDAVLFSPNRMDQTIYNGFALGLLKTDYGENDFLVTYDNRYYFQFRHFITNRKNHHVYNLLLYRQQDTIYIKAIIKGKNDMGFTRPMHLISEAALLRCNGPIDSNKVFYNMVELE